MPPQLNEMYDLLARIGVKKRFVIKRIFPRTKLPQDEPVVVSTDKLPQIAGIVKDLFFYSREPNRSNHNRFSSFLSEKANLLRSEEGLDC